MRPTLHLDFANTRRLDPRITFARASSGTYFDQFGLLKSASANTPRFDHDPLTGECKGLLIEELRTNLLTYSEQFDNAAWGKTNLTITANAATSPDGTQSADKIVSAAVTGYESLSRTISVTAGTFYTYSAYAKASEFNCLSLQAGGTTWQVQANSGVRFNLTTGVMTAYNGQNVSNARLENVGNGWFRCSVTWECTVTTSTGVVSLIQSNLDSLAQPTGDGVSGLYLWGAQLEAGSFPTSYIPTTSASATRAADVAQMTGANFSSWYRQDEGTFVADGQVAFAGSSSRCFLSADDGTANERHQIRFNGVSALSTICVDGGVAQASPGSVAGTFTMGVNHATAYTYRINDIHAAMDGVPFTPDTAATIPTPTQLQIGNGAGINYLSGAIRRLTYYPKRLDNATLQALSA